MLSFATFTECSEGLEALTMTANDGREAIDVNYFEFLHHREDALGTMIGES